MIGKDQGRIFEIGFNIGILTYLHEQELASDWVNTYQEDLKKLDFEEICNKIVENNQVISVVDQQIINSWTQGILLKSFLGGYHFFQDYLETLRSRHIKILYYQCSFWGNNSFGCNSKPDVTAHKEWLLKLEAFQPDLLDRYQKSYTSQGEFLQADTLMLLSDGDHSYKILVVDLSSFELQSEGKIENILDFINLLKQQSIKEINYLRSKSVFSKLQIDTGGKTDLSFLFSSGLKDYFTAFKTKDKESAKVIQAGSYAYSFYGFLKKIGKISESDRVVLNVVGYSDRGMNTMNLSQENIQLLKACYEIYTQDCSDKDIQNCRRKVLNQIKHKIRSSFYQGGEFVDKVANIPPDKTTLISHQEQIDNFLPSVAIIPEKVAQEYQLDPALDLRNAHAELIHRALQSEDLYLFLTGNPGIGKTTAIANFLKEHKEEGFLFLYASPRKQVNLDLLKKFKHDQSDSFCDPSLICLNTNFQILSESRNSSYTVQYLSDQWQGDITKKSVLFLDATKREQWQHKNRTKIKRQTEELLISQSSYASGVIKNICEAIHVLIDSECTRQIVASISIQSLRKNQYGKDTLEHFEAIFKGAYNRKTQKVIPAKMRDISRRIKHFFVMIDEITGDDAGVEFLNRIAQLVKQYQLHTKEQGFNTKIIIADASIVDQAVIEQHLGDRTPEPDKIFFRKTTQTHSPLSQQHFKFKNAQATLINTNSYPASRLDITYHLIINAAQFDNCDILKKQKNDILDQIHNKILQDIDSCSQENTGQILVYIQDKQRLQRLIECIKSQRRIFEKQQDYLEVHANLSEQERQQIDQYQNQVKIIFMTSCGSRGLSFPNVRQILVDIPHFQIERNLMEIIQVIYRGRGNKVLDNQPKKIIFYLGERATYYSEDPIYLQENSLNILTFLLLLKAALMTRIVGSGIIGKDSYILIPIGGKSISAAGETFIDQMANFLQKIKSEVSRRPGDQKLQKVLNHFQQLLKQADFKIPPLQSKYIEENFIADFLKLTRKNLDNLLNFHSLPKAYIQGSLLLVPLADQVILQTYTLFLQLIRDYKAEQLLKNLCFIKKDQDDYPESLKYAAQSALQFIDAIRTQTERTQRYEQQTQRLEQYYALPLFALILRKQMQNYLAEENSYSYLKTNYLKTNYCHILKRYVRTLYPVDNLLPIGDAYRDFPFVVFDSYSLAEIRSKVFAHTYLLNSYEFNILNLVLAKES